MLFAQQSFEAAKLGCEKMFGKKDKHIGHCVNGAQK